MATKPSPSWPPFRPKLRINGQTPSDRIFLSPKVLTSPVAFSPTRPPAFPSQADRPTRSATVFPSIARCISSNAEPSFRVSALPPTATLEIARYFGETFVAPSRDRLGESRRNACWIERARFHGKWTGPIRESGRILSVLPITHSMRKTPVQLLCRTVGEHASDR
jgi:hypothetical protein